MNTFIPFLTMQMKIMAAECLKSIKYNHALKYYAILSSSEETKLNRINSIVTNIMMKLQKERACLVANTIFRSL